MGKWQNLLGATIACALFAGCAKDQNVEQYKRDKARQDSSLYQAVSGRYSGLMISGAAGKVLGALELNLTTRFKVTTNPDGSASLATPILVTEVNFEDTRRMSIAATDGYFDPESGVYQADIPITGSDGKISSISLTAHIGGGKLDGSLQALGYKSYGSTFSLNLNGDSLDNLARDSNVAATAPGQDVLQLSSFAGKTTFSKINAQKYVRLVVLQPRIGSQEDFLNLLVPVKTVQVSFNYDASAHILSSTSSWDMRTGLLTGSTTIVRNNQNVTLSFDCQTKVVGASGTVECTHYTSQLGIVAHTQGTYQPVPSADPVDNSNTDAAVTKIFQGTTHFTGDKGARNIHLAAVYPARTRLDDLYNLFIPESQFQLQITIRFSEDLTVSFYQSQWDASTGHVDAINTPSSATPVPGAPGGGSTPNPGAPGANDPTWAPELHCTGFFFQDTKKPFACVYSSNRSGNIQMNFRP